MLLFAAIALTPGTFRNVPQLARRHRLAGLQAVFRCEGHIESGRYINDSMGLGNRDPRRLGYFPHALGGRKQAHHRHAKKAWYGEESAISGVMELAALQ